MLVTTIAKCCVGFLVAGTAIAVPVLTTRNFWATTTVKNSDEAQGQARTPNSGTVSSHSRSTPDEQNFHDCLDKYLDEFEIRNPRTQDTKTVTVQDLPNYIKPRGEWEVVKTKYDKQCKKE